MIAFAIPESPSPAVSAAVVFVAVVLFIAGTMLASEYRAWKASRQAAEDDYAVRRELRRQASRDGLIVFGFEDIDVEFVDRRRGTA